MGSPVAALVSHLETVHAVAVYTPIFGFNAMIAQHLGRWGPSVRGVSDVLRSATVARLASPVDLLAVEPSPPPERRLIVGAWQTEWRCERRRRSGSLPGSMRKAAADCSGDLLRITDRQVDPCLALGLWHAHRRAADGDRAQDVACGIEYRCGKPGC